MGPGCLKEGTSVSDEGATIANAQSLSCRYFHVLNDHESGIFLPHGRPPRCPADTLRIGPDTGNPESRWELRAGA
jgi:hypothetical protein